MDPIPDPIPSVGCLLYVAADQVVASRPSVLFYMTRVPCKRVRVDPIHLSAVVLAATFLSLQESGHLSFRIHEESLRIIPAGVMPSMTLYAEVLDTTSRPGLAGALLSAAINSPDGWVGTADGEPGYMFGRDESHVLGLLVKHPYVEKEVQRELVQAGAYTHLAEHSGRTAPGSPRLQGCAPMLCAGGSSSRLLRRACVRCCLPSVGRRPFRRTACRSPG